MSENLKEILNLLEMDDLNGDTLILAELTGLDIVKKLLLNCDGLTFSLQRVRNMEGLLLRYLKKKYPSKYYSKSEIINISKEIERPYRETIRLLKKSRFEL